MTSEIGVRGSGSVSALGASADEIRQSLQANEHLFQKNEAGDWVSPLSNSAELELEQLLQTSKVHRKTDRVVHLALLAAQKAIDEAGWKRERFGVNIGSSRGATGLWEQYYDQFRQQQNSPTNSSPATTLGNISYWVGQYFKSNGPAFSHSITCSSSFHAILNAIAWLQAGMAERFLVGGAEASLTPFTLSQMKALKIYSSKDSSYPCQPFQPESGGMLLGEGAGMLALEPKTGQAKALISGWGWSTEGIDSPTSISSSGSALEHAMKMALHQHDISEVDAIIAHAPGNSKGDEAELNALKKVFGSKIPPLTSNKWKIGHLLGASGVLSLEMAILMVQDNQFYPMPFHSYQSMPERIDNVLVNSTGFGGNAVSILVSRNS